MVKQNETPLTERKVVRRGLIAGLAGLGAAALFRLTGASKAEADGEALLKGLDNGLAIGVTEFKRNNSSGPTFKVWNGPNSGSISSGNALQGVSEHGSGFHVAGVYGLNTGNGVGVIGETSSEFGVGIIGRNGLTSGALTRVKIGVDGQSISSDGIGTRGVNSSNGTGVYGISNNGGDFAATGNGTGTGVHGKSGTGTGVIGQATLANAPGAIGVDGSAQGNGIGVRGISNTGGPVGGLGTGSGKGVYGLSGSGDGVHGSSTNGVGLRGTSPNFVGMVGISDFNIGLYGYNAAAGVPAFYAENLAPSGNRIAGWFNGDVRVMGNFVVTGVKNAAVKLPDGSEAVVYCQESPEPYFEDFGHGQLVGGVARVNLDADFVSLVRRESYMVFPVAGGDCNGLYVGKQDASGFEVRELKGGTSSVPFTYRVVAKRADVQGKRLERIDPKVARGVATIRALGIDGKATGAAPNSPPDNRGGGQGSTR